jgi:hypothetical protein
MRNEFHQIVEITLSYENLIHDEICKQWREIWKFYLKHLWHDEYVGK